MNFEERKRQAKGADAAEAFGIMARELFDYANGCGWPTEKLLIEHLYEVAQENYHNYYAEPVKPMIDIELFDGNNKDDVFDAVRKAFEQLAGYEPDDTPDDSAEACTVEPMPEPDEPDMIQNPPHYNKFSFQPIDIIAEVTNYYEGSTAFYIGTVLKYLCRAPFKGKLPEDLKKAAYYLQRAIDEMEETE